MKRQIIRILQIPLILSFFFISFTSAALAHDDSLTYSSISITDNVINVAITTPYNNIVIVYKKGVEGAVIDTEIDNIDPKFFTQHFKKGFIVENNGKQCAPKFTNAQKIPDIKKIAYQYEFKCKEALGKLKFSYNLFFDISKTHENITDIYVDNFGTQIIFSKKLMTHTIDVKEIQNKVDTYHMLWNGFNFLKLGIEHIFMGYDHILFLLGLILVTYRFRQLLKIISSFTVAHSITLIIASLGIFVLPSRLTESLIALSITYIALENLKIIALKKGQAPQWFLKLTKHIPADTSKRWIIAFVFGLIHGFGFSSVLQAIGLPEKGLLVSLLTFNVGVEIGQLVIISLIFPILLYLKHKMWELKAAKILSITIGLIGLFWFLQRVFT